MGTLAVQTVQFDYGLLDRPIREPLQRHARQITELARSAAHNLWQAGRLLADAQAQLASYGNGTFQDWVETGAGLSLSTCYRLINVYHAFNCSNLTQTTFAISALYVLSESSTPPEALAEALWRAERGEPISRAKAQEIVGQYRLFLRLFLLCPHCPPLPSTGRSSGKS